MEIATTFLLVMFFISLFTSFYWLFLIFGAKELKCGEKPKRAKITVIIPAYNEEENIAATIRAVKQQTYRNYGEIEILVIDDGSTDRTAEIARKEGAKVIRGNHEGKARAVNLGIKHATGDYVLILDADTILDKRAIEEAMKCIGDSFAVVGRAIAIGKGSLAELQKLEYEIGNYTREILASYGILNLVPGAFSIIKKEAFDKLGYLAEDTLTEDFEFGMRLASHGYRITFAKKALAYTKVPETLSAWFRQRLRWYRGRLQNMWRYKWRILKFDDFSFYLLSEFIGYLLFIVVLISFIYFALKFLINKLRELLAILLSKVVVFSWKTSFHEFLRRLNPLLYDITPATIFILLLIFYLAFIFWAKDKYNIKVKEDNFIIYVLLYTKALTLAWIKSIIDEIRGAKRRW